MTQMGLDYLKHKETQRSNLANEAETHRSNYANETERHRANLANETETHRSNLAREAETNRSNLAKEFETNRSNIQNEILKDKEIQVKMNDVAEKIRHNMKAEDLDSFKATISNLPPGVKEAVSMLVAKEDPTIGNMMDETAANSRETISYVKNRLPMIKEKVVGFLVNPNNSPFLPKFRSKNEPKFAFGVGRNF